MCRKQVSGTISIRLMEELMKKDFDEEKAEILVKIIPFALIIVILMITLVVSSVKNSRLKKENIDLQDSIKEYADANLPENMETAGTSVTSERSPSPENTATAMPSPSADPEETAVPTPYKEIMEKGKVDYSKIEFDKDVQLKELMTYWADNNQKAVDDLVNLDRFRAMSWELRGTKNSYYYGETDNDGNPQGKGVAVYADNQYYYGNWENGVRSGAGTWIHYHVHVQDNNEDLYTYHQYAGVWKNDLPDGEGSEHYEFNTDNFKENTRYTSNLIGSYAAGLVNGEFYITTIDKEEKMSEWEASADHGSWVYQSDSTDLKGNRTVHVDIHDPDNYIWINPKLNNNIGVPCLISKNKN